MADNSTVPSVQEATGEAETKSSNEAVSDTSQQVEKTRGTNVSKAIADDIMLLEMERCGLANLHNYYECKQKSCKDFSEEEEARQKKLKKRRFHHSWVEERELAYDNTTGIWWLLFSENQGMFCFLCCKHKTLNTQNNAAVFSTTPSTRYRKEAIREHSLTKMHEAAVEAEMNQRVSMFHQQYEEKKAVRNDVLYNAFAALYWLAKEAVANVKFFSLLNLFRAVGLDKMQHFNHKSPAAVREMFLTSGNVVKNMIIEEIKKAGSYGLLIDEVTDIAVTEQLITFVQFWNSTSGGTEIKFLSANDLLVESDSANAETITSTLVKELNQCNLSVGKLNGLCTDGASVMTGKTSGVATRLKELNKHLVSIHCICHKLSLACCDTNDEIACMQEVERWLFQAWKFFENSPKRLAAYLKTQLSVKKLQEPSKEAKDKCVRRLAKATRTRWLSLGKAVEGVHKDYIPLMLTLRQLDQKDAQASGLLGKMYKVKFIGVVTVMHHVLPVLNKLSCTFQEGKISFSHIKPAIQKCIDDLDKIVQTGVPVTEFLRDLSPGGRLEQADLIASDGDELFLSNFLVKYVNSLKKSLNSRFPTLPLLSAFSIFDPALVPERGQPGFRDYGSVSVKLLAEQFFDEDSDKRQLMDEWQVFKYDLAKWKNELPEEVRKPPGGSKPTVTSTDWCLQKLMFMKDLVPFNLPLVAKVAEAVISLPVSNGWPERGASSLKLMKTRLRSRMKNDMLNALLHILINGPKVGSKEFEEVIDASVRAWLAAKPRRKCPPKFVSTPVVASAGDISENFVTVQDAGVQTEGDAEGVTPSHPSIAEEVDATSKALELPADDGDDSDYGSDFDDF